MIGIVAAFARESRFPDLIFNKGLLVEFNPAIEVFVMGNGLANIVAAVIVAAAILWVGGVGEDATQSDAEYEAWLARAVGDIRNDVVVNCGCCGEGKRRAASNSF